MFECEFSTQPPTFVAVKTTSFKSSLRGGQFEPESGGQFAPELGGQLRPESGGHIDRNFQPFSQKVCFMEEPERNELSRFYR